MKPLIRIFALLIASLWSTALPTNAQVNVTQKNNNPSRDGLYIDPAFTPGNAANLVRDLNFNGTIVGNVHAQPLYIEGGPNGPMIIAVTASNNIYALNANTGAVIWQRTDIGPAVISGHTEHLWVYLSAPVIGAALAIPLWKYLTSKNTPV